ncbi:hypothetical protein JC796_17670 [Delftia acidovorans]|uniref:hypothetical protein n=1 Tax=Delftia acidovorans TaxID=80866 RepID=UPI0018E6F1FB|nr:hypothetical protein [Delftia acidovorans]MBJ2142575.1 hypothetical protein [Delftia acidovorans]
MTTTTIPAAEFAARLARCTTGLPIGADALTLEQAAGAFLRISLETAKQGHELAALAAQARATPDPSLKDAS